MHSTMRRLLTTALLVIAVASSGCESRSAERVRLATTTSTHNSGLLDFLLPPFEDSTGIDVDVLSVGTGQALALGARGDVDVVLVHAREREDEFIATGAGVDRRDVMWNDFVILGPSEDPAGVRGTSSAEALRRIHDGEHLFVSRGDDSGTHIRERSLWRAAGLAPPTHRRYLEAGQGQGACLLLADQRRAYVLCDRGTYIAYAGRTDLDVLVEGGAELRNAYGVMRVNPGRHPTVNTDAATTLLDYLTSPEGQERIAAFRIRGEALFHSVTEND